MRLVIVRHGAAVPGGDLDAERVLQPQGHDQAVAAGKWLRSRDFTAAQVLSSPYIRARQTAEHICDEVGLPEPALQEVLTPDTSAQLAVELLTQLTSDVIIVSHLPLVGRMASLLVEGQVLDQPWSTGECWVLEGDVYAAGCMQVSAAWYPGCVE
jgi:phosphohistidine phosphatase